MPTYEKLIVAAGERLVAAAIKRELKFQLENGGKVDVAAHEQIAKDVRRTVQGALRAWLTLPKPAPLGKLADEMRAVAASLNVGEGITGASLVPTSTAKLDLISLNTELAKLDGEAINVFKTKYAAPLPGVVAAHCSIAAFLGSVIVGEQRIFTAVRHDVLEVVRRATEAMDSETGGSTVVFRVTGTEIGTPGVFAGGDAANAGGNALLGSLSGLLPSVQNLTLTTHRIGSGRWGQIMDDTERVLVALSEAIASREKAFDDACAAAIKQIRSQRATFDLAPPSAVLEATDPSRLGISGGAKEIKLDLAVVKRIGDQVMPDIAQAYLAAVQHSEDAVDSSAWKRNDKIGLGPHGAYQGWRQLQDFFVDLLRDTRREIQRAGNHLMIAGRLVTESDEDVRAQLKEHRDRGGSTLVLESTGPVSVGSVSVGSGIQGAVGTSPTGGAAAPHTPPVSGGVAPR